MKKILISLLLLGAACMPASDMCQRRLREKRACMDAFLLEFGGCKGDSSCEGNAFALLAGCHSIPLDSCPAGGRKRK